MDLKYDIVNCNILSMEGIIQLIENTIEKSSICDFRRFISKYNNVTKWIMCSDYCFDDSSKPNNVISFVLYPYIADFSDWQTAIDTLQPADLKKSRHISNAFRDFTHLGLFFSFNFVLNKSGTFFDKWRNKDILMYVVNQYIELMDTWKKTTPQGTDRYNEYQRSLKVLHTKMNAKNFNVKLFHRTFITIILASYIKYLLYREVQKVEIFSWLSDRDAITSMSDGVYEDLYAIVSYCIAAQHNLGDKYNDSQEVSPSNFNEDFFWDSLNRVPDIICGILADHNVATNEVSKEKHLEGVEDILADNPNIVVLSVGEKGIGRVNYSKKPFY